MMSPAHRGRIRLPDALRDLVALVLLAAYALLAWSAEGGATGATLDPVLAAARARGTLNVAVDAGFRPFADFQGGQIVGYDVDLARAIAEQMGLGVAFVPTGYDGLYDTLTSGRADLIAAGLPYAPEQGYRARFSSFYFDVGQVLVTSAGGPALGAGDLAGRRVGVALGSDADALARNRLRSGEAIDLRSSYDEPAQALADLRAGQLDAVITDNVSALGATHQDATLQISAAVSSEPLALALPRAAFQLEAEVNQAIEQLRREGFFEELNRRWMR